MHNTLNYKSNKRNDILIIKVFRVAAIMILIFAIAVVSLSGAKTAKIISDNLRKMVRQSSDIKQTVEILKIIFSGKGKKEDIRSLTESVFGLQDLSEQSYNGREIFPDRLL